MPRLNYIIIPALFLINMGVDGATIANTLTSAHHSIRDSPNHQPRGVALLQNRQYRAADFSSDPSSTTDQPAIPEAADADNSLDIPTPEFLPRGSVFPALGDDLESSHSKRGDRPAINFSQPQRRAHSADNGEICDDLSSASFDRRLDSGVSMNAVSDALPNGDPLVTPPGNLPPNDPPASNAPVNDPSANNLPANPPPGTFGSNQVSNAVGTSNLMNSALGSGGVRDELSNFHSRDVARSHGMGPASVNHELEMARDATNDGAEEWDVDIDEADEDDADDNLDEDTNKTDTDDDDDDDDELESRQRMPHRLPSRLGPHFTQGAPDVGAPEKVAKMEKVMKGKNVLETTGGRKVGKKSRAHGAATVFNHPEMM